MPLGMQIHIWYLIFNRNTDQYTKQLEKSLISESRDTRLLDAVQVSVKTHAYFNMACSCLNKMKNY